MIGMRRTRMIRIAAILAVLALVALLAGCGGSSGATTGSTSSPAPAATSSGGGSAPATTGTKITVTEQNFAFSPADVKAKVGDTLEFVNNDSAPHEVSIDGTDLGQQTKGQSVTWTATKAGSIPFSCVIHPSMTGKVTVQ